MASGSRFAIEALANLTRMMAGGPLKVRLVTGDPGQAVEVDARLDVIFSRPCACPERHAVTGTCPQKAELATRIGGMCRPCAYCFTGYDWLGDQPLLEASMPVNRPRLD